MKKGIHPEYHQAQAQCTGCGNSFLIGSTKPQIQMNVCSKCHPFFTGNQKFVDAAGRIERFNKKYGKPSSAPAK
jgi:large subunit ribosomal protein L31